MPKRKKSMADNVTKIPLPIQMQTPAPTNTTVQQIGYDWVCTNSTTSEVNIQTGIMNAVIFPETGKFQEYRHLMKGQVKPKWTRDILNEISHPFQGIRYIEETDTYFFIHRHEMTQYSKVTYCHIVCDIIPQKK